MKHKLYKDLQQRINYNKIELKKQQLKYLKNKTQSIEEKILIQNNLNELIQSTGRSKIKNKCQITGRSRGVLKKFGLSRITFRNYAANSLLMGIQKYSW